MKKSLFLWILFFFLLCNISAFAKPPHHKDSPPSFNLAPKILKITPEDNTLILAGDTIEIKTLAVDPNRGSLEFQFSINNSIRQEWSVKNSYLWEISDAAEAGYVHITCEVRNNKGGSEVKSLRYRIINPTIEEILDKVTDNYSLLNDFKADMTLFSTLNGEPFGGIEYCKYYFLAPRKEKTETYSDQNRNKKTQIIIIDNANMFLIDRINKTKEDINLLNELGLVAVKLNEMDIFYNMENFLSGHTVIRDNANTDFKNLIIGLDAVPNEPNNLYSKLELYIDYNKGILLKSCVYRNDRLQQTIEIIKVEQKANGFWIPVIMRKMPHLTENVLVTTMVYNNVHINTGLTDDDFDPEQQ